MQTRGKPVGVETRLAAFDAAIEIGFRILTWKPLRHLIQYFDRKEIVDYSVGERRGARILRGHLVGNATKVGGKIHTALFPYHLQKRHRSGRQYQEVLLGGEYSKEHMPQTMNSPSAAKSDKNQLTISDTVSIRE